MEDWHGAPSSLPRGLAPHGAHCAAKCPKWYPREDHACLQWQCRAVAMHGAQLCAESTVYTGKASMREQGRIGATVPQQMRCARQPAGPGFGLPGAGCRLSRASNPAPTPRQAAGANVDSPVVLLERDGHALFALKCTLGTVERSAVKWKSMRFFYARPAP